MVSRSWERQRLNERPIYLRSLYLGLAVFQTGLHLWFDYDSIQRPVESTNHGSSSGERPKVPTNPVELMKGESPTLLREIGITSSVAAIIGPIIYSLTVRKIAWQTSVACARLLRWDIPRTAELSIIPPYHISLIVRSLVSGFCLLLLWRASNLAFSAYVAQEPIKRGQVLTQDSNDPNGTLINGLKSRKSLVKVDALPFLGNPAHAFDRHSHSGSWQRLAEISQPAVAPSSGTSIAPVDRHGRRYLQNA